MTENNITPPPELMQEWQKRFELGADIFQLFTGIFQAGADQELEACIAFVRRGPWCSEKLRAARRPKPPSLKEQALALLDPSNTYGSVTRDEEYRISVTKAEIIRRALEQLDD
jgi:hypothetical protein